MTILWDSDPTAAETYQFAVSDRIEVVEVAHMVTRALATDPSELLVIVGPDVDLPSASSLAEQIRSERPAVSVILLRRRLDVAVLGQALRAGFREVIASDDLTSLSNACRRSLQISHQLIGIAGGAAAHGVEFRVGQAGRSGGGGGGRATILRRPQTGASGRHPADWHGGGGQESAILP